MIIIKHRVNTISSLKKTQENLGVEIDLRSKNKQLYLHHDPFKNGVLFSKWLRHYKHSFIVLNVKEEGLEKEILRELKKRKVKNFFFHDQTFSTVLKNMKKTKVSIRYSEFEELKKINFLFRSIKWIWIDHFKNFELKKNFYFYLKKKKVKICIVSPELVNIKHVNKIQSLIKNLKKQKISIDAVCTKKPKLWAEYYL
tara:strand:+ start:15 stop:608 length:594 start_codon:yes stop_codon:yes gene_type:complete